jgi:hypothetical protein
MLKNTNTKGQCTKFNKNKCNCCSRHSSKSNSKTQRNYFSSTLKARLKNDVKNDETSACKKATEQNRNPCEIIITVNDNDKPTLTRDQRKLSVFNRRDTVVYRHSIVSEAKRGRPEILPNRFNFSTRQRSHNGSCYDNSFGKFAYQSVLKNETPKSSPIIRRSRSSKNESFTESFQNEDYETGRFSCGLSKIGQCAMLKTYEDELYSKMKMKFPKNHFPRVETPLFNTNVDLKQVKKPSRSSLSSSVSCTSLTSLTDDNTLRKTNTSISSWDTFENEHSKKYQVSKQIEDAMEILDDLVKIKSLNQIEPFRMDDLVFNLQVKDQDKASVENSLMIDNTIKKYERWHFNWSRMLTDMF